MPVVTNLGVHSASTIAAENPLPLASVKSNESTTKIHPEDVFCRAQESNRASKVSVEPLTEFKSNVWPASVSKAKFGVKRAGRIALGITTAGLSEAARYGARAGIYPGSIKRFRKEQEGIFPLAEGVSYYKDYLKGVELSLKTPDGVKLNAMWVPMSGETRNVAAPTVVYFLGNADYYEQRFSLASFYSQLGCNVLMFNRRGYSKSSGSLSLDPDGTVIDGETVYQYLRTLGVPENKIILHGWSMGGAVAAQVARNHPEVNLILDRTFTNLSDEAEHFVFGAGVTLKYGIANAWAYDSERALQKSKGQKLIFWSPSDSVIGKKARLGTIKAGKEFAVEVPFSHVEDPFDCASEALENCDPDHPTAQQRYLCAVRELVKSII